LAVTAEWILKEVKDQGTQRGESGKSARIDLLSQNTDHQQTPIDIGCVQLVFGAHA
jgi:hypothetical protein